MCSFYLSVRGVKVPVGSLFNPVVYAHDYKTWRYSERCRESVHYCILVCIRHFWLIISRIRVWGLVCSVCACVLQRNRRASVMAHPRVSEVPPREVSSQNSQVSGLEPPEPSWSRVDTLHPGDIVVSNGAGTTIYCMTHWGLVAHKCISEVDHHWSRFISLWS